jgi:hypothetical protein
MPLRRRNRSFFIRRNSKSRFKPSPVPSVILSVAKDLNQSTPRCKYSVEIIGGSQFLDFTAFAAERKNQSIP